MPKSNLLTAARLAAPKIVMFSTGLVTHLILFILVSVPFVARGALTSRCAANLLPAIPGSANARTHVDVDSIVDFIEESKVPDHLYEVHAQQSQQAAGILAGRVHFDTAATRIAIDVMLEVAQHEHAPLSLARLVDTEAYANLSLDLIETLPPATHVVRVHAQGPKPVDAPSIARLDVDVHRKEILVYANEVYGIYHGADLVVDDQTGHGPALALSFNESGVPVIHTETFGIRYLNGTKHNLRIDRILSITRKLAERIYPHATHFNLQAIDGSLKLPRSSEDSDLKGKSLDH